MIERVWFGDDRERLGSHILIEHGLLNDMKLDLSVFLRDLHGKPLDNTTPVEKMDIVVDSVLKLVQSQERLVVVYVVVKSRVHEAIAEARLPYSTVLSEVLSTTSAQAHHAGYELRHTRRSSRGPGQETLGNYM